MIEQTTTQKMVTVTNRDNGAVCCILANKSINFNSGETKKVLLDDLIELNSSDGGARLLKKYLVIKDEEAQKILDMSVEPEYYYTKQEIKELLANGSLDQLEDCLNFAPEGVIDLLKDIALEMELPDTRKRTLIAEKTGFNIDNILNTKKILDVDTNIKGEPVEKTRKAPVPVVNGAPQRKAEPISTEKKPTYPDYKVVTTAKKD